MKSEAKADGVQLSFNLTTLSVPLSLCRCAALSQTEKMKNYKGDSNSGPSNLKSTALLTVLGFLRWLGGRNNLGYWKRSLR